ncbi:restriction endonuclease subunit S [Fructobacillus sp. W13]|uniref:Restriction endonuclease subunit S n=1 Tax=Fructobacillus apis TaxID=2935017 RepID=A0ABT0ZR89_9LACO|nr:restriction endonuclease subunit S [Fructobacillus apis]MCO0832511.1 restriction endonuclease subunit S [Fructobacillus apis]
MADKVPDIRFKGFSDGWEQRKLGDEVQFLNGRAYKQSELLDKGKYKVLRVGNFNTNERWYYSDLELDKNKYVESGDLMYLWATNFGPELWTGPKTIYHYHIWKLKLNSDHVDRDFLYTWLLKDKEAIKQSTNGTTMVHVTKGNMEQRDFVWTDINEQQCIGQLFMKTDKLITLHQRKLSQLEKFKSSLLQNLFPKNGATNPSVRFGEFTNDWEQRKLGDLTTHKNGVAIEKYFVEDGPYKVISIGSYGKNNEYVDQGLRTEKNDTTASRIAQHGDLTMVLNDKTTSGEIIGRVLRINADDEYVINQRTELLRVSDDFDSQFAYTILNGPFRNKVKRIVQGGTQIYVNYSAVASLSLSLPEKEEQQAIALMFERVQNLITLHQRKLDSLEKLKKLLLQKMFI